MITTALHGFLIRLIIEGPDNSAYIILEGYCCLKRMTHFVDIGTLKKRQLRFNLKLVRSISKCVLRNK